LSAADGERHDLSPSKPREGHAEAVALLVGASADVLPGVRKDAQGKHQCIGALANQSDVDQISRRHRFDRDVKIALGSTASDYPRTLRQAAWDVVDLLVIIFVTSGGMSSTRPGGRPSSTFATPSPRRVRGV